MNGSRARNVPAALTVLLLVAVLHAAAGAEEVSRVAPTAQEQDMVTHAVIPPRLPVYHIPVRIHLNKSGRSAADFRPVLDEINAIWLSQAGICFEMQIVNNDEVRSDGMDVWFLPILPGGLWLNGYYRNDHNIQVRNRPELGPAEHPAQYPAARTTAHELGHGLGLMHRQDSEDNLMRSKSYGWKLNDDEVRQARETAERMALPDRELHCAAVE